MASRIQPETIPPTVTAKTPADGATGVNVGASATATFSEPMKASTITTSTFQLKDASEHAVAATVTYNASTQRATLTPQSALAYGATYTVTVKGGAGGVDGPGRQRARRRRELVVHDRGLAAADPRRRPRRRIRSACYLGEILRNEGLNAFTTIDVAFLSPALLSQFDVVVLGDVALNATQVSTLTGWVNGGGNLVAMRPDKQLAGLLGLDDGDGTTSNALPEGGCERRAGSRHRRQHDPVPRHCRPLHAERRAPRSRRCTPTRRTATANPAVTLRVGRDERRPGGRVHVRPRPLGRLHAPGKSRVGGPGARRRGGHPPRRHVLRRQGRRRADRLGQHEQDRDPPGRRAAAAARQPDHGHGARQASAAALLVPAARREGRCRDERRRPLAEPGARRHRLATSTTSSR